MVGGEERLVDGAQALCCLLLASHERKRRIQLARWSADGHVHPHANETPSEISAIASAYSFRAFAGRKSAPSDPHISPSPSERWINALQIVNSVNLPTPNCTHVLKAKASHTAQFYVRRGAS